MTFKPLTALVILLSAALGIIGYMMMGEPGMGDLPMAKRQGAILEKVRSAPGSLTPVETLSILESRVKDAPEDPEPHFFIGEMLRAEGRPNDAARAYQSALRRDGDFVPALVGLGNTMMAMNEGMIGPEATQLFARAYELDETQVQSGMRAAMGAAQAGNQDVAEKAMRYIYNRLPEGDPRRERFRPMIEAIGQAGDEAAPGE